MDRFYKIDLNLLEELDTALDEKIKKHFIENTTLCARPWNQLSSSPVGDLTYCCDAVTDWKGDPRKFKDFWNSDLQCSVRKKLIDGDMSQYCHKCLSKEKQGLPSMRISSFNDVNLEQLQQDIEFSEKNHGKSNRSPQVIDIRFSTVCNMKCRMCSPSNSNQIYNEIQRNRKFFEEQGLIFSVNDVKEKIEKGPISWNINSLLEFCNEPKMVIASGGEPLLHKPFLNLIEKLVSSGLTQNISIQISTNGSVFDEEFLNKLKQFKHVRLLLSVDGIGKTYDYIRYPFKWDIIEKNILKFRQYHSPSFEVILSPTIQALNLTHLSELLTWATNHSVDFELFTSVTDPDHLSVDILPSQSIKHAIVKLKKFTEDYKLNSEQSSQIERLCISLQNKACQKKSETARKREKFYKHMVLLDNLRDQSLKESLPEIYSLLFKKPLFQRILAPLNRP